MEPTSALEPTRLPPPPPPKPAIASAKADVALALVRTSRSPFAARWRSLQAGDQDAEHTRVHIPYSRDPPRSMVVRTWERRRCSGRCWKLPLRDIIPRGARGMLAVSVGVMYGRVDYAAPAGRQHHAGGMGFGRVSGLTFAADRWMHGWRCVGQESLSQVTQKTSKAADADKENPAATRKRKTSTQSTSSQQSQQPTSKRPVLGTVAELDMVRETHAHNGSIHIHIPHLLSSGVSVKGGRAFFQHTVLTHSVAHLLVRVGGGGEMKRFRRQRPLPRPTRRRATPA
jgi:hypothetical protein